MGKEKRERLWCMASKRWKTRRGFKAVFLSFFSRVHATLQPTLSVCRLVGRSVGRWHFAFSTFTGGFGVTAPAQLLNWSISSLPLPTRTRLGQPCIRPCWTRVPGYDKVPKHLSIACRHQADFAGRETGKKNYEKRKFKYIIMILWILWKKNILSFYHKKLFLFYHSLYLGYRYMEIDANLT